MINNPVTYHGMVSYVKSFFGLDNKTELIKLIENTSGTNTSSVPVAVITDLGLVTDVANVDLNAGSYFTLSINSEITINITNPTTPSTIIIEVKHITGGSKISNLPGVLSSNFLWAAGANDTTLIGGIYNGTEWKWVSDKFSVYDSDALAYVTAANVVDAGHITAFGALVSGLKGYGLWTKMKAFYPLYGTSLASGKFNLKDPRNLDAAFRLTQSGTGTFANGFTNTSGYLNTLISPFGIGADYSINLSIRTNVEEFAFEYGSGADQYDTFGARVATNSMYISSDNDGDIYNSSDSVTSIHNYNVNSFAANFRFYVDGVLNNTHTRTRLALTGSPILIGNGANLGFPSTKRISTFAIFTSLTNTEVDNLNTLIVAFEAALGR